MGALRKIMIGIVILGAIAGIQQAGTFASFNATTTNSSSAFQTGALALGNSVNTNTATACFSYGASASGFSNGNTNACTAAFAFSANQVPNNTASTADITVHAPSANTLTATNLKLYASTVCASGNDGGTIHGNGNLCSTIKMTIQEYPTALRDGANAPLSPTASSKCAFPFDASNACPAAASGGLLSTFTATLGSPISLTGGLNSTGRFFKVSLVYPSGAAGAENSTMGLTSSFVIGWTID